MSKEFTRGGNSPCLNKEEKQTMIEIKLGAGRKINHKVTTVTKENVKVLIEEYNYKTKGDK